MDYTCRLFHYVIHPLILGVVTKGDERLELQLCRLDLFYQLTVFISIITLRFYPSVSISYSILAFPMHVQVFGITHLHEYHIFSSNTEWNFLFTLPCTCSDGVCMQSAVNQIIKLFAVLHIFFTSRCESSSFFFYVGFYFRQLCYL